MLSICLDTARLNAWVPPRICRYPGNFDFHRVCLLSSVLVVHPDGCLLVSDALMGDVTRFASEIHRFSSVGLSEHSPACREN